LKGKFLFPYAEQNGSPESRRRTQTPKNSNLQWLILEDKPEDLRNFMKMSIYLRGGGTLQERKEQQEEILFGEQREFNNTMQCMLLAVKVPRSQTFRTTLWSSLPLCREQL